MKFESPTGRELAAFRLAIRIGGKPCTQEQFGRPIGCDGQRISNYEREFRGVRMPPELWVLARITWDALARAQWIRSLPRVDQ